MLAGALAATTVAMLGALARVAVRATRRSRARARLAPVDGAAASGPRELVLRPPAWWSHALGHAGLVVPVDRAWTAWVGAIGVIAVLGLALGGVALALLAVGAACGGSLLALRGQRGRAGTLLERSLPAAVEAVARSLRSGASLRLAVAEAAESSRGALRVELRRVASEAGHGVALVDALSGLARRRPLPGVRLVVAALSLGAETGGAQAQAVDGVAATLRDRLAVADEARALTSQTRASVWVIALAPAGFCVFASATDPRTAQFLFRTPMGLAFVATGLALDALGALWMRRLSRLDP